MRFIMILQSLLLGLVLFILYSAFGTWLWNTLMPIIFGLPTISFWQMYGLLWLSRFLFYHSDYSVKVED